MYKYHQTVGLLSLNSITTFSMVSDINIRSGLSKKDFIVARPMEAVYLHFKKIIFHYVSWSIKLVFLKFGFYFSSFSCQWDCDIDCFLKMNVTKN